GDVLAGTLALVMCTSASGGLIFVGAVATSLPALVSVAPLVDTRTVLVTVWLTGVVLFTLTVSVIVPNAPATRELMTVHVRLPPDTAPQPEPAFERTNDVPAA